MMPLENAAPIVSKSCRGSAWEYVLMMGISDPRECTGDTDGHSQIRNYAHYQHRVVVVFVVDEYEHHSKDEPHKSRRCAS